MLIPFSPRTCSVRNTKTQDANTTTTPNDALLHLVIEQDPSLRNQLLAVVDAKILHLEEEKQEGEQNEKPADLQQCDRVKQWLDIPHFGRRRCAFRCDAHQRQLFSQAATRVMLNCSRQSGKSTVAALKAVHMAAHRSGCTIVITAPIKQQTRELIRKVRHFASMASLTQSAEKFGVQFRNGSRVVGVAADEDTIRGFSSVALVIVDEAARVADDVFHAVLPMLAVSSGSMWMMSTPKGKRGFFYNEWINELSGWLRHLVRAAECPRIPDLFLEEQRQRLGVRLYAQEFECQFMDNNLGYFDPDSVRKVIKKEIKPLDF